MSQFDQIAAIDSVVGRSLRMEEISTEAWMRDLLGFMPTYVAKYLLDACAAATGQPCLRYVHSGRVDRTSGADVFRMPTDRRAQAEVY